MPYLKRKINDLEIQLNKLENNMEIKSDDKIFMMATLSENLQKLEQQRHQSTCNSVKIKNYLYGETISKYWTGLNKQRSSKSLIYR